jgi:hypothetical protein
VIRDSLPKPDHARGVAGRDGMGGDIHGNYRTGSNHRAPADADAVQNDDAETEPDVILNDKPALGREGLFTNGLAEGDAMVVRVKAAMGSNLGAATYLNAPEERREIAALLNVTVGADADGAAFAGIDERVTVEMNVIAEFNRPAAVPLVNSDVVTHKDMATKAKIIVINDGARRHVPAGVQVGKMDPAEIRSGANSCQPRRGPTHWTAAGIAHPKARPKPLRFTGGSHDESLATAAWLVGQGVLPCARRID